MIKSVSLVLNPASALRHSQEQKISMPHLHTTCNKQRTLCNSNQTTKEERTLHHHILIQAHTVKLGNIVEGVRRIRRLLRTIVMSSRYLVKRRLLKSLSARLMPYLDDKLYLLEHFLHVRYFSHSLPRIFL